MSPLYEEDNSPFGKRILHLISHNLLYTKGIGSVRKARDALASREGSQNRPSDFCNVQLHLAFCRRGSKTEDVVLTQ